MDETSADAFKASRTWFNNFKKRTGVHSVVRRGEAASSDMKAAEIFVREFREYIKAEGFVAQHVLNCDETGLFWGKKMPRRTCIPTEEKKMSGL